MYSFDIFDTLITRTTATPQGIFALMGDRLRRERESNGLDDYIIGNFYELRTYSEEFARQVGRHRQIEEITLRDIYEAMAATGCLSQVQIEYLCHLEQETEIANTVGISGNIARLKRLLQEGERVILISDMYLPQQTIRRMLCQADNVFQTIPMYVSSECGKRKTTGNLYRFVRDKERINIESWIHIGDNLYQDIEVPYKLGIQPEIFSGKELTNFEKRVLASGRGDSRLEIMIGTASRAENMSKKSEAYIIGYRYVGPILYCYAEWIVNQAVKKGIRRLYFIARDGYLVKSIVETIVNRKNVDIATHYIYGSRKAWRMASLSEEHYNLYQLVFWSHIMRIRTLADLAAILHITITELYPFLPGMFAEQKEDGAITCQELEYITRKLASDERFKKYHLEKLKDERELARRYLVQEIDIYDKNFAFVDVSGGGLTQGCLKELLRDSYQKPIRTFFFRMDRINLIEGSITDVFMPCYLENSLTIEMICRAPHGQTAGYKAEQGRIVPQLEAVNEKLLAGHDFAGYEKGILDFTSRMQETADRCGIAVGSMKTVLDYMKYIMEEPSKEILEYFGSMPSNESGRGREVLEYAPRLSKEEIKQIFLMRTYEPVEFFYRGTALNYSVMRATEEEKALIEYYKREHNRIFGKVSRQEADRKLKKQQERYGKAAFYPVRLLEKRIVLYGAGKMGQDLYHKLQDDGGHEVVLWVDKNAEECRQRTMSDIREVCEIEKVSFDQIVIAVVKKELAESICAELQAKGIGENKMIWLPVMSYPNQPVIWNIGETG